MGKQIHIALLDPACERVLLIAQGDRWMLPALESESDFWIADVETVNKAIKTAWNADTIVLRCLVSPHPDRSEVFMSHTSDRDWQPPADASWISLSALASLNFARPAQLTVLEQWLAASGDKGTDMRQLPWISPKWYDEVMPWISEQIRNENGQTIASAPEQVKSWSFSSVLRVHTHTAIFYFKAVPSLFGNEPQITQKLTGLFPIHVPKPVAIDTDRHWMLMRKFPGRTLRESKDFAGCIRAIQIFAKMQIECILRIDELIAWNCADRRLRLMAKQIETMLNEVTSPDSRHIYGITDEEAPALRAHAPFLKDLCVQLAEFGVPETLIHGDLHPGNIMIDEAAGQNQPLIFDWTDAAIGHPFFDLETMLEKRWVKVQPDALTILRDAYLEPWCDILPYETLIAAFEISQKLAPVYHSISYRNIIMGVPASSRWELSEHAGYFLRTLLTRLP